MLFENISSAESFHRLVQTQEQAKAEYKRRLNEQAEQTKKQTSLLEEAKELSAEYTNCTRQILECTRQNQISGDKQFKASITISIIAIIIAIISLIYSCISSNSAAKQYEQQLKKQDKIIELLNAKQR